MEIKKELEFSRSLIYWENKKLANLGLTKKEEINQTFKVHTFFLEISL